MNRGVPNAAAVYDALMGMTNEQVLAFGEAIKDNPLIAEVDRALEHNISVMNINKEKIGGTVSQTKVQDLEPVIVIQMLDLLIKFITRKAKTCRHIDPSTPMPLVGSAWKPGLITCHACARMHVLPNSDPANWTCDLCGTVVPRERAGTDLRVFSLPFGALLYQWGACIDCCTEEQKKALDG